MALILTHLGSQGMLTSFFGSTAKPTYYTLKLYTNAGAVDTTTSFTFVPNTAYGGSDKTLQLSDVTVFGQSSGFLIPKALWPVQNFVFSQTNLTNPVVGYALCDSGGNVVFFEPFAATYNPANVGDTLAVTIQFLLGNLATGVAPF